jgi:hypothetical protein
MEKQHINTDITGDILHELATRYNVTLREINQIVWNRVYAIVCDCSKKLISKEKVQMDLFDN